MAFKRRSCEHIRAVQRNAFIGLDIVEGVCGCTTRCRDTCIRTTDGFYGTASKDPFDGAAIVLASYSCQVCRTAVRTDIARVITVTDSAALRLSRDTTTYIADNGSQIGTLTDGTAVVVACNTAGSTGGGIGTKHPSCHLEVLYRSSQIAEEAGHRLVRIDIDNDGITIALEGALESMRIVVHQTNRCPIVQFQVTSHNSTPPSFRHRYWFHCSRYL